VARTEQPLLADRYALESLIATGGMGRIWRARDTVLHRPVAVKVLRSEYADDPTFLARFRAEAQLTASLTHRNIAALHDYGETRSEAGGEHPSASDRPGPEHVAYLVMELVEGESLSALLHREGRLPVPRALDVLWQVANGLAAAHAAGVVHRDVKPGNVLVGDDGVVRITDFGVAWSAASVALTRTGQVVGTPHYLSPEQAEGAKASPASDVYALGMIAYECLAGRRAFEGESAVQIALRQIRDVPDPLPADLPEAVRALVDRALAKDPARRLPDGAAFRDAVDDVLAGRALPPRPVPPVTAPLDIPVPAVVRRRRPRRALAPLVALAAGALLGVGVLPALIAPATPEIPAASAGTGGITLVAGEYAGRPLADVEAELAGLGLRTERSARPTAEAAPGVVLEITPAGAVERGDTITVVHAVAPPAEAVEPAPAPQPDPGAGGSPGEAVVPATTADTAGGGVEVDEDTDEDADEDEGNPGRGENNGRRGEGNNGRGRGNG
jgi:serine/threonine-protein kinase